MPNTYDQKYIDNGCLKEIKKKYYKDPRYPNIPQGEKEKMLILIRSRLSSQIFSSSGKLDGAEHHARSLVNLEKINSAEVLESSQYVILRWLWGCIKKDLNRISEMFLYYKVLIPQGNEQKQLQEEYLDMISDAAKVLIKRVVENLDEYDATYISDNELKELTESYCEDQRFPTISHEEKQRILKRLRHRVAVVTHESADGSDDEKNIAQRLLNLESIDEIPVLSHLHSHLCWLWHCLKQDFDRIAEVFEYDNIVIPKDEANANLRNQYLEFIANATKTLIQKTALSSNELNQYEVTATSGSNHHKSILKKTAKSSIDDEDGEKEATQHVTWQVPTTQPNDLQPTKKQKFTDDTATEDGTDSPTLS
jgi:hypothetical protein